MADEPNAAGGAGAAAAPAQPEQSPSAVATETETPEQLRERLSKSEKENEAHRKTQAEWQPQIEELNRLKAAGVTTPPTSVPAPGDPLDQLVDSLSRQASSYPDDPSVAFNLLQARERQRQREMARAIERESPKFAAVTDDKVRARAWQLWTGGYTLTPEVAIAAAERELLGDVTKIKADLAREREEIEKDKKARAEGRMSLGSRPALGPDKPAGEGLVRVPQSKWDHLEDLPVDEQRDWLRRYNSGQVEVVPG